MVANLGHKYPFNKKLQGIANKSHRKLLGITYKEMKTNEYFKDVIISLIVKYEPILQSIEETTRSTK